jgi:hypothetical protein
MLRQHSSKFPQVYTRECIEVNIVLTYAIEYTQTHALFYQVHAARWNAAVSAQITNAIHCF